MTLIHGTCLIVAGAGVLLRGPSGSGKSDLAFRLIEAGEAGLVADDQTEVTNHDGRAHAACPPNLAGLIEVRGLGILRRPYRPTATIDLVIDLVAHDAVPRMPTQQTTVITDVTLPLHCLCAFEASVTAKVMALATDAAARPKKTEIIHA